MAQPSFRAYGEYDGILGLGFGNSSIDNVVSPLQNLYNLGLIPRLMFAMYLGTNPDDADGGELILGGYDSSHCVGDIQWLPVNQSAAWWTITVDSVRSKDETILSTPFEVIVDSGTSFIRGPRAVTTKINEFIGVVHNAGTGDYTVACDKIETLPNVEIVLGGKVYSLAPKNYIQQANETYCFSGFLGADDSLFIFGDVFLTNVYTIYDLSGNRVGFAELSG